MRMRHGKEAKIVLAGHFQGMRVSVRWWGDGGGWGEGDMHLLRRLILHNAPALRASCRLHIEDESP